MSFSIFFGKQTRTLLGCLLALVMLVSLCLTAGAVKDEQTLLSLDPNEMSLRGSDGNFSWENLNNDSDSSLVSVTTDTYQGKVLSFGPGIYWIYDTNGILPTYDVVAVSTDLYFENFPNRSINDKSDHYNSRRKMQRIHSIRYSEPPQGKSTSSEKQ
jgi:hypothetical protein